MHPGTSVPAQPTAEAPWCAREDWARGRLESVDGGLGTVVAAWLLALVWNAGSWLALVEAVRGNAEGATELAPVFPLVGLLVLGLAAYLTGRHLRWGRARLELLTLPGVLGGPLRCVLHTSSALARAEALEATLDCTGFEAPLDRTPFEASRSRLGVMRLLWRHRTRVPRERFELSEDAARVPLAFTLPYALPESDPDRTGADATWVLSVRARVAGVDHRARFELPVFRTAKSAPEVEGSPAEPARIEPGDGGADAAGTGSGIRVRPWGRGGREVDFGMLRSPAASALLALATLFAGGLLALVVASGGPLPVALAFGLLALVLAGATVESLVGTIRVRAEPGRIQVTRGWFGLGWTRSLPVHEIARIRAVPGMQSGNRLYYRIRIELAEGARRPEARARRLRCTAGTRIADRARAEALARLLAESAGLTPAASPASPRAGSAPRR